MKFAALMLTVQLTFAATAEPSADAWDVVATLAAALAEPNYAGFMKPIAKSCDQHDRIERLVRALIQTNDVVSSISPIMNEGDDKQRMLEVDWYMEIQPQTAGGNQTRRHEYIKATLTKTGKRWMITALIPIEFFAPPSTN